MNQESPIVNFGKHRGRSVADLAKTEPSYLQFLAQQDWFREKFTDLYNAVQSQLDDPDTPETQAQRFQAPTRSSSPVTAEATAKAIVDKRGTGYAKAVIAALQAEVALAEAPAIAAGFDDDEPDIDVPF